MEPDRHDQGRAEILPARRGGRHARVEYPWVDGKVTRHQPMPHSPVFIHALTGRHDAGRACFMLARNLLMTLQHERLVTFNADDFLTYSTLRPSITMDKREVVNYEPLEIAIDLLRDDEGTELVLLHGYEPTLRWEEFSDTVTALAEEMQVRMAIGTRSVAMTFPHTRPVPVLSHGNATAELAAIGFTLSEEEEPQEWPASMATTLEYKIGKRQIPSVGFTAGVPFYAQGTWYPQAGAELIRRISAITDLALPLGDLEAAHVHASRDITEEVERDEHVSQALGLMEKAYDEKVGPDDEWQQPFADTPTADEIGAAAEAFLADLMRNHKTDRPDTP
ncbi:MAG: PAC2 family protein [Bowdeniella nasicola]|nr:PAC2 family protein [Bowdeniella nasicola]